jgi:hypothetical protein
MDMKCLVAIAFAAMISSATYAQPAPKDPPVKEPPIKDAQVKEAPAKADAPKDASEKDPPVKDGAVKDAAGEAPKTKPRPANPIGDALCGRDAKSKALAAALDGFEPDAAPADWSWHKQPLAGLSPWLGATECADASAEEKARYTARTAALKRLEQHLARGQTVMQVRAHLAELRPPVPRDPEWPASCAPCQSLREIVDQLQALAKPPADAPAAGSVPAAVPGTIGERLQHSRDFSTLRTSVCQPASSAAALETAVRSQFAYFTWTKTGTGVLAAAAVLRRSSFTELCR